MSPDDRSPAGPDGSDVADLLRHARDAVGLSQQALAEAAGFSASYIWQLENGRRDFSGSAVRKIRKALLDAGAESEAPEVARFSEAADTAGGPSQSGSRARPGSSDRGGPSTASVPVGAIPGGEERQLAPEHLGEEEGQLWVDPTAPSVPSGSWMWPRTVRRAEDGVLLVDVSRMPLNDGRVEIGTRDPQRHVLLVKRTYALPGDIIDFRGYTRTTITVRHDGKEYRATRGRGGGPFPQGVEEVVVLSAANPWPYLLTESENTKAMDELRDHLARDLGDKGLRWDDATTAAPDGISFPEEASVALFDVDIDLATDLAREHGQQSLFIWTPTHLQVKPLGEDSIDEFLTEWTTPASRTPDSNPD